MSQDRFEQLMMQSYQAQKGPVQVALMEEAVREADTLNDVERAFEARMELVQAATFSGQQEKALVAFSWCLGQADRDPDRFDEGQLLWQYKWVLEHLPAFPQISRAQIERMQDDFHARLLRQGSGLRAAHYMRWSMLAEMGCFDEALRHFELWRASPYDWLADCRACERNKQVRLLIRLHRNEEALADAGPILAGKLRCAEIPHLTLGHIMVPLLRLGRREEAREHHAKGYRLVSKNPEFLWIVARHLMFLVADDDLAKGVKLLERHLPWALTTMSLDRRFLFYVASSLLLEKLAATGKPRKLRLPRELPSYREDDLYAPAELAGWFREEARVLAARFNDRNGNRFFTEQEQGCRQLVGLEMQST